MQLLQPTPFWNFWIKLGSKNKIIHLRDFNNAFLRYEFLKESLGLLWVKLQNSWFDSKISISSIYEVLVSHSLVYEGSFGQIWVKITEWSIVLLTDLNISILVLISQILVFHFVHFEYKKVFWHILVKFIAYRGFLSSSRSNKNQFQLVDHVIGRL